MSLTLLLKNLARSIFAEYTSHALFETHARSIIFMPLRHPSLNLPS